MTAALKDDDREFVSQATQEFKRALTRVVASHERAGRSANVVLGDPRSFAERAVYATAPEASPWDELVGPFLRSDGVQARLGISRQAVAAKAARRRLLRTVTADGEHLYPLWQFAGDQLVDGLAEVFSLFPESSVDGWTLAAWLRTPDPDLGEPPLDALARGERERVRTVARSAARSLSA
ncbi:hypothetical protein [Mycobacterium branderi]|uniref:DNA-binding protein n=1 Tax=Mycobacterium branderi TaxID=43348 RepID=A0A7I7WBI7_9MYCO|nr:hypothetical protein [Mycobacterium branderi]MCV7235190.1 hypothetical protein [Mycobacterium branderi]ORA31838.1 hypothetical protein BST20_25940 [Mycobacterium branderi]BBZ14959.1 hypothetical protein MBRA_51540 [Mycobacterium branderi]